MLGIDVGVAFAARFLIRLTSLLPEAVNLRQTARDVEQVAEILTCGMLDANIVGVDRADSV
jgi:hypothetical protein